MNSAPVSFATKVDRWLVGVLAIGVAMQVGAAGALLAAPDVAWAPAIALAVVVLPIALVALLSLPTRYELHADELVIRSGVVRYRIPYRDLREVHPTRNPLSAPAWSLDRLKLRRTSGYALISPSDQSRFLQELARRTPHLTLQGDRLVPR